MPEIAGDILAARLRYHAPDLPVLYVTGHDEVLFQARPFLWDREFFLAKPFSIAGLREAMTIALFGRIDRSRLDLTQ